MGNSDRYLILATPLDYALHGTGECRFAVAKNVATQGLFEALQRGLNLYRSQNEGIESCFERTDGGATRRVCERPFDRNALLPRGYLGPSTLSLLVSWRIFGSWAAHPVSVDGMARQVRQLTADLYDDLFPNSNSVDLRPQHGVTQNFAALIAGKCSTLGGGNTGGDGTQRELEEQAGVVSKTTTRVVLGAALVVGLVLAFRS